VRNFSPSTRAYTRHGRGSTREQHNRRLARSHQLQFRAPPLLNWALSLTSRARLTRQRVSHWATVTRHKHDSIIHARIIFSPTNTDQACGNNTPPFSSTRFNHQGWVQNPPRSINMHNSTWQGKSGRFLSFCDYLSFCNNHRAWVQYTDTRVNRSRALYCWCKFPGSRQVLKLANKNRAIMTVILSCAGSVTLKMLAAIAIL
jgi:hypothetical protein